MTLLTIIVSYLAIGLIIMYVARKSVDIVIKTRMHECTEEEMNEAVKYIDTFQGFAFMVTLWPLCIGSMLYMKYKESK